MVFPKNIGMMVAVDANGFVVPCDNSANQLIGVVVDSNCEEEVWKYDIEKKDFVKEIPNFYNVRVKISNGYYVNSVILNKK